MREQMGSAALRVVLIASEMGPWAKTGGLADVMESLPPALRHLGIDLRLILPGYRQMLQAGIPAGSVHTGLHAWLGPQRLAFSVHRMRTETGIPIDLIEREDMFDRPNLYADSQGDYYDNAERFIFFCRALTVWLQTWDIVPHIVHCNDWHTGLVPVLLQSIPAFRSSATLFTIHNLGYPGLFDADKFALTGLDPNHHYRPDGLEFFGRWSMLKAGMFYSRAVSTVSPTYAREIQQPEYGRGFDGVLAARSASVFGILNGVDYGKWSPEKDPHIAANYSRKDLSGKSACKADLIRRCGLAADLHKQPVIGIVSRLDTQKGIDLILPILDQLMDDLHLGLIILGTGDKNLENRLAEASGSSRKRLAFIPQFDEVLSRQILAGADMLLVPSRYEPCGLTQLYAMQYATIPVVRATGGLNDTVVDVDADPANGWGFTFGRADPQDCLSAIERAAALYRRSPGEWQRIQQRGMAMDFSWDRSALAYQRLYRSLISDSTT